MSKLADMPSVLKEYRHTYQLPVLWNDMDVMQHVNNTVYFRYLESARIDMVRTLASEMGGGNAAGEELAKSTEQSIALAEVGCRFRQSLTFPDTITIGTGIREIGETHFLIEQAIYSPKLDAVAAIGKAHMVYYDYINRQRLQIQGDFLAALEKYAL